MLLGVETGGTTIRVARAERPDHVDEVVALRTAGGSDTVPRIQTTLARLAQHGHVSAVGVAAFGPVDVDPRSPTYGRVGSTPKPGWAGVDLPAALAEVVDAPVVLDTDVTAAALAEQQWGAGVGRRDVAYVTVGTGVGVGAVVENRLLHGTAHPELGHLLVRRHPDDTFAGVCPFHGDCLEGLASGPALAKRWQSDPADLGPQQDLARAMESWYLAQLVVTLVYALAPALVVVGGGVAAMPGLLQHTGVAAAHLLGGALGDHPLAAGEPFVVPSALSGRAGLLGALTLAHRGRHAL